MIPGHVAKGGSRQMDLKDHIRTIPDFPKPGILFYDISTLLAHPAAWATTVEALGKAAASHKPDVLAGIESRGFLVQSTNQEPFLVFLKFSKFRKIWHFPVRCVERNIDQLESLLLGQFNPKRKD